jgi:hypothetical protein
MMRRMAFGDVDHEAEAAQQAEIASEVEAAVAQPQDPAPRVAGTPADLQETDAPVEEVVEVEQPTVTVQRTTDEPTEIVIAGYVIDLREEDSVAEVPYVYAEDLADSEVVEVVEEAIA